MVNRQTRFATFPQTLIIHAKKFQLVNWVPAKLDIPIILPEGDILVFGEGQLGKGVQPGEVEIVDTDVGDGGAGEYFITHSRFF
jgi:ubiquitin carboxyl-terminal hydrolase 5/13